MGTVRGPVPLHPASPPESSRTRVAPTDRELVEAVVSGDVRVAAQIHDRLVSVVDQTLVRILGRRESDHDDLVQTTFEQILRSLGRGQFRGACSLRTWANRIATHVALNAIRSKKRERRVIERDGDEARLTTLVPVEGRTEAEVEVIRLREQLAAMTESQAELLLLHDLYGYALTEIAEMLDISEAAAQSRLVRGRKDLRKRLARARSLAGGTRP